MKESVVGDIAMLKNKHKVYGTFAYHTAYNYGNTAAQEEPLYEVPSTNLPKKAEPGPRWLPLLARNLYFLS